MSRDPMFPKFLDLSDNVSDNGFIYPMSNSNASPMGYMNTYKLSGIDSSRNLPLRYSKPAPQEGWPPGALALQQQIDKLSAELGYPSNFGSGSALSSNLGPEVIYQVGQNQMGLNPLSYSQLSGLTQMMTPSLSSGGLGFQGDVTAGTIRSSGSKSRFTSNDRSRGNERLKRRSLSPPPSSSSKRRASQRSFRDPIGSYAPPMDSDRSPVSMAGASGRLHGPATFLSSERSEWKRRVEIGTSDRSSESTRSSQRKVVSADKSLKERRSDKESLPPRLVTTQAGEAERSREKKKAVPVTLGPSSSSVTRRLDGMKGITNAYVFRCNKQTLGECMDRSLFGATVNEWSRIQGITIETAIFLLDTSSKELHGVFYAKQAGMDLEPRAWGGRFPAQVKVGVWYAGPPIKVEDFVKCIPSSESRGKPGWVPSTLDKSSVQRVLKLFDTKRR